MMDYAEFPWQSVMKHHIRLISFKRRNSKDCQNHASSNSGVLRWKLGRFPVTLMCFVVSFSHFNKCAILTLKQATIASFQILTYLLYIMPTTVGARSKAWTVFVRSNVGIVGSNPTRGIDICVNSVFVLGSGLATGWSLVQGVLPNVLD
jgi:hypothetical protein